MGPIESAATIISRGRRATCRREERIKMTERYHCEACGWDGDRPAVREEADPLGTWTLRVCPACGAEVYATVVTPAPRLHVCMYRCPACGPLTRAEVAHREIDEVCLL